MNEKLAVRIPASMKRKVRVEAKSRLLDPADIVREALREYFERQAPEKKEAVA